MSTFRAVWLLRNLSLDGELCLRDGKNAAFVILFKFTISISVAGEPGKRHARHANMPQAVSGWLNQIQEYSRVLYEQNRSVILSKAHHNTCLHAYCI